LLIEDLLTRPTHSESALPVHIINVDIKDNHEEALLGGQAILKLVEMLEEIDEDEIDGKVEDILAKWIRGPVGYDLYTTGVRSFRHGVHIQRLQDTNTKCREFSKS
jgi:Ssu72-like protein